MAGGKRDPYDGGDFLHAHRLDGRYYGSVEKDAHERLDKVFAWVNGHFGRHPVTKARSKEREMGARLMLLLTVQMAVHHPEGWQAVCDTVVRGFTMMDDDNTTARRSAEVFSLLYDAGLLAKSEAEEGPA